MHLKALLTLPMLILLMSSSIAMGAAGTGSTGGGGHCEVRCLIRDEVKLFETVCISALEYERYQDEQRDFLTTDFITDNGKHLPILSCGDDLVR